MARNLWRIAACGMIIFGAICGDAQSLNENRFKTILRGLEYRESLVQSAAAVFDVVVTPTADPWYVERAGDRLKSKHRLIKVFWAFDRDKVRQDEVVTHPDSPELDRDTQTAFDGYYGYYYDRTHAQGEKITVGAVSEAERYWSGLWGWLQVYPPLLVGSPLSYQLREEGELLGRTVIDGADVYQVRVVRTSKERQVTEEWWFAPQYDFLALKHVTTVAVDDDEVEQKVVTMRVTEVSNSSQGVWVPSCATQTVSVRLRDGREAVGYVTRYNLCMVMLNESLSASQFQVEFLPGAIVAMDDTVVQVGDETTEQ